MKARTWLASGRSFNQVRAEELAAQARTLIDRGAVYYRQRCRDGEVRVAPGRSCRRCSRREAWRRSPSARAPALGVFEMRAPGGEQAGGVVAQPTPTWRRQAGRPRPAHLKRRRAGAPARPGDLGVTVFGKTSRHRALAAEFRGARPASAIASCRRAARAGADRPAALEDSSRPGAGARSAQDQALTDYTACAGGRAVVSCSPAATWLRAHWPQSASRFRAMGSTRASRPTVPAPRGLADGAGEDLRGAAAGRPR